MKFFRNPEIAASMLWHLFLLILSAILGFSISPAAGYLMAVFSLLYLFSHYLITWKRYRKLEQLSREIDDMLHSQIPIHFEKYQEGELSILENELSKMTLRLSEQAAALLQDKKLLADSMADISHQIRSPLTSSNLILSLLRNPDLTAERRSQLLKDLTQLLSRIDWLVESLLKMSKMDAGTAYLTHIPVSVEELVHRAAEPLLIPMELREQTLSFHAKSQQAQFMGDLSWSTEALLNILKNCMEHTPPGGLISVAFSENTIYTEITVTDNGPGFEKEDLPHLFERFYKGKHAGPQNVGIGLALARMIISQQNGTLKAENRPEGGAKFTIKFYR
ncbi:MAG: HAMP domain-containing histidine kinase [Lachnospiraceae bacterium]|nr:HAMP domain-containing histidine kinase [Lachnospiraceae bacterium]